MIITFTGNPRNESCLRRRFLVIVPPDTELFESGLELYEKRPDKDWSLTDCISFVVMKREGIVDALTGDHHFEQGGFNALLKPGS
jgi:predicted nucleic acid-binding protein